MITLRSYIFDNLSNNLSGNFVKILLLNYNHYIEMYDNTKTYIDLKSCDIN